MKMLAGVEEVSDETLKDLSTNHHTHNNNVNEKLKLLEETEQKTQEPVSWQCIWNILTSNPRYNLLSHKFQMLNKKYMLQCILCATIIKVYS